MFSPSDNKDDKSSNKLFVASIDFEVDDDELADIFSKAGKVVSTKVILDDQGRSKGFGFVEMENNKDAESAIEKLNGSEHHTRNRKLVVAFQKNSYYRPILKKKEHSSKHEAAVANDKQPQENELNANQESK